MVGLGSNRPWFHRRQHGVLFVENGQRFLRGLPMAIASICEHCGCGFKAPDASLGDGVVCPTCGKKTKVFDEVGSREVEDRLRQEERREQEYHSRLALLRELEERNRVDSNRGGIEESVRNFQPRVGTRNRRLRLQGHLLMVISWVVLLGALLLAFISMIESPLGGLTIALIGLFGFAVLKFLSEASHSMAEMADRQWDIRALLLDLREEQERQKQSKDL